MIYNRTTMMTASPLYVVTFLPSGKAVVVSRGANLLEAAHRAGIDLSAICNGQRDCGECCIEVLEGPVSSLEEEEEFYLPPSERQQGGRLACCTRVYGPVKVRVPASVSSPSAATPPPDNPLLSDD